MAAYASETGGQNDRLVDRTFIIVDIKARLFRLSSQSQSPGPDLLGAGAFALPHHLVANQRASQSGNHRPAHHEFTRDTPGGIT